MITKNANGVVIRADRLDIKTLPGEHIISVSDIKKTVRGLRNTLSKYGDPYGKGITLLSPSRAEFVDGDAIEHIIVYWTTATKALVVSSYNDGKSHIGGLDLDYVSGRELLQGCVDVHIDDVVFDSSISARW